MGRNAGQWNQYLSNQLQTNLSSPQYTATVFPVLAPVDVNHNAAALGLFSFLRSFAQVGIQLDHGENISDDLRRSV